MTRIARSLQVALVGNPNCGKTALFNRLTGARQKVANYSGVTVDRKEGSFTSASGMDFRIIDLPGAYSLTPMTPDELITRDALSGTLDGEPLPDIIILVVDATNLRLNLRLALEVARLNRPMLLALNMMDVARDRGLDIDKQLLQNELGMPVVETVAIQSGGANALIAQLDALASQLQYAPCVAPKLPEAAPTAEAMQRDVRRILDLCIRKEGRTSTRSERLDKFALHPVLGYVILASLLFLVFQAVFSWSKFPMDVIKSGVDALGTWLAQNMAEGILRSLLVEGILSGVGSVLVFLPQILILFFFILALEESGYLPRAAFLLDRLMGCVGLSGRAFIPLLSSFACAVPGIMATRTIQHPRDRLATIMIAPLMTCSARLPVYALIIGAFIPEKDVGIFNLQGLVLFGLYLAGIVSAMLVAYIFKHIFAKNRTTPLMLEMPNYHWPNLRGLAIGLWERARIFITRVGTIILALMIVLWFLSTFPSPPEGAIGPAIQYSFAGRIGLWLEVIFRPIGFNWQITIALIPGMAAREVAVGALGTVYALSATGDELSVMLTPMIASSWSLPTALSLLAWYVFAPQCISTIITVKRETNSWMPAVAMLIYMFALAYLAAFATYRIAILLTGGSG
ncbi:MAG: ferrous iron transporter B [Oxalobacter sp.]|nr:MAG: ferrous iron transporter B [Oxalobacter sp.]